MRVPARLMLMMIAVLLAPLIAEASPRISLGGIRGDRKSVLSRQLVGALCETWECVPRGRVYTGTKPDFAKLRRREVSGVVYGSVAHKAGRRTLWLALVTRSTKPERTWVFALDRGGRLPQTALERLYIDLQRQLGSGRTPAPSTGADASAPLASTALPRRQAAVMPPSNGPSTTQPPPASDPPTTIAMLPGEPPPGWSPRIAEPAPSSAPARNSQRFVAAELGFLLTNRNLQFGGGTAGSVPLQGYEVGAFSNPALRLEVFPAAKVEGFLSGFGVFGDYAFSIGLKTKAADGTDQSTSFSRLQLGALWRIRPIEDSQFALVPSVSYQHEGFTVDPPQIQGLPNSDLSGFKLAVGAEVPFSRRFTGLVDIGYIRWTSAKDLIAGTPPNQFFPSGTAQAFEIQGGVLWWLSGPVSLRFELIYTGTAYALDPDPNGTFGATQATDQYFGGRTVVRTEF